MELQQLKCAPECGTRDQPHFHEDVYMANYKPDATMAKRANTKDVSWLLVRHYSSPQQPVPAWTGFNQRTIKDYTRWGVVYAADISQLETSHPDVYKKFIELICREVITNTFNNQISTDLSYENVNKVGKVTGRLNGIKRSDRARDRWCLTYNERSRIVD